MNQLKFAFGKEIPDTLEELVDVKQCALLVIDVQNDYAKRDGNLLYPEMTQRLREVIMEARRIGVLLVYVQDTLLPDRFSDSPAWIRHYMHTEHHKNPVEIFPDTVEGTVGHQVIDELHPLPEEIVVKKFRSSAFYGTNLDLLLRSNNIKSVIVTGVVTQGCVESTCRDASNEYFVVVLKDCVDSNKKDLHEACLKIMESRYDVVTSGQLLAIWKKHPNRAD